MTDPFGGSDPFGLQRRGPARWFRRGRSRPPRAPTMPDWSDDAGAGDAGTGDAGTDDTDTEVPAARRALVVAISLGLLVMGMAMAVLMAMGGDTP